MSNRYSDGVEELPRHDPRKFADDDWLFPELTSNVDAFVDMYVKGIPRDVAVIRAFEMIKHGRHLGNADALAAALLSVPSVAAKIAARIRESKPDELWHARLSAHKLLQIVMDDRHRESSRLNAIAQLNVLLGITEIADTGQQKLVDRSLADFYARRIERQFGAETRH
ncbi:hypothetical protein [Burkholderia cenocepacia]|uniref:hypothetical protein n=1 Tax=Burkholderia cenocepacia TaxID=95486 RepID=UPI0006AC4B44|nr:hypothetical protein [Burkholderia cenocepacia]